MTASVWLLRNPWNIKWAPCSNPPGISSFFRTPLEFCCPVAGFSHKEKFKLYRSAKCNADAPAPWFFPPLFFLFTHDFGGRGAGIFQGVMAYT